MEVQSTPSLAGPARRSRRQGTFGRDGPAAVNGDGLQSTPPKYKPETPGYGHRGSATTAAGSPYSGRPKSSMQSQSEARVERRKSMGEGLLRRARKSIGWLIGRGVEDSSVDESADADNAAENGPSNNESNDVELGGQRSSTPLPGSYIPHRRTSSMAASTSKRPHSIAAYPGSSAGADFKQFGGYGDPPMSVLSTTDTADERSPGKRMRTSHSTLNLPTIASIPKDSGKWPNAPNVVDSHPPAPYGRHRSPVRASPLSRPAGLALPPSKSSIFSNGPSPLHSSHTTNGISSALSSPASPRRSPSPSALSPNTVPFPSQQAGQTETYDFGLRSQSPFRINRSPEVSLAPLNLSSGLARSPSVSHDRLPQSQTASRLYPYGRQASSLLSPGARSSFAFPTSHSYAGSLGAYAGQKRGLSAISNSPPKVSPVHSTYSNRYRHGTPMGVSPTLTDFDHLHRAKRQRTSFVWHPERGFVAGDEDGKPIEEPEEPIEAPKNDAERILQRLESTRTLQVNGLRSHSPQRISVPVPSASQGLPASASAIFATKISSSLPTTASESAISPIARRQRAAQEEAAVQRGRINDRGGLGERLRDADMARQRKVSSRTKSPESVVESNSGRDRRRMHSTRERDEDIDDVDLDHTEDDDIVEDLPVPVRTKKAVRSRSQSVLSNTSAMDEDGAVSPRRSARQRMKSHEPMSDAEAPAPKSRSKVVKTPKKEKAASAKRAKAQSPQSQGSASDVEVEEGVRTRSGRRLRSPSAAPASPPPVLRSSTVKRKAASPAAAAATAQRGIEQVLDSQSATPRAARSAFSARHIDDDDDRVVVQPDSSGANGSTEHLQKLRLPSSVFASRNRFRFTSSPSSPKLGPSPSQQSAAIIESNSGLVPLATIGSSGNVKASSVPSFGLLPAAAETGTADPAPIQLPKASASTSISGTSSSSVPARSSTPLFSFTAPQPPQESPALLPFKVSGPLASSANGTPASASATAPPAFSFSAPTKNTPKPGAEAPSPASNFAFGKSSSDQQDPKEVKAPVFSFNNPTTAATSATPSVASSGNPFAAFSKPAPPAAAENTKPETAAKATPFSFTSTSKAASDPSIASETASAVRPAFSFGTKPLAAQADAAKPDQATAALAAPSSQPEKPANVPAFSFGSTTTSAPAAASKSPAFSFAPASPSKPQASTTSPTPPASSAGTTSAFNLGQTTPAATAGTAPAFKFAFNGAAPASSTPAANTTPAFSFGGSASQANPFASPAAGGSAVPPASTGSGNGSLPKPFAFGFGAPAAGAAVAPAPSGTPGVKPGPAGGSLFNTNGSAAPAFSFGSTTTAATPFSFGSAAGTTSPLPTPTFGTASSTQPAFAFGAAASAPLTPGGSPISPATSLFNVGSGGDDSTSPQKRTIRPLRTTKRR